jgi:beta-glucosidase
MRVHRKVAATVALALLMAAIVSSSASSAPANTAPGWDVGTLTDSELHALIGQMTLAEEVAMIHGAPEGANCNSNPANGPIFPVISPSVQGCVGQAGYNNGVPRLGIPPLRQTDGPAGVRLNHQETALPAPVGLTATFDRQAAKGYGRVIGREGRATNQDVLYAPMINQVAYPTGGRNFETLGEDPFLAGELVAPEVKGVQDEGLIATLKHFAQNDFENARMQTSIAIGEQTLHELELKSFEKGIGAGAGAVMCAYSRVNDVYSCSNDLLLNQILRGMFGFTGWVLSDFGATHRLSDLINGLDSAMPNGNAAGLVDGDDATPNNLREPPGVGAPGTGHTLTHAILNGTDAVPLANDWPAVPAHSGAEWKAALDNAVFHILTSMNKAGLLEGTQYGSQHTDGTPFVPARPDLAELAPGDFDVAENVAEKSATLLRNDGGLPLRSGDLRKGLVVMGPTATAPYLGGGGSAHVTPFEPVQNPLAALREGAGSRADIGWVPGYDLDGELVPASAVPQGWLRTQISTTQPPSGSAPDPCSGSCAANRVDSTVNAIGADSLPAGTAWRWQGTLTAPSAGSWQLKVFVAGQSSAQLFVDGLTTAQRRINIGAFGTSGGIGGSATPAWDGLNQTQKSHDPSLPQLQQGAFTITLAAGETHSLDLRAYGNSADPLQVRFAWVPPDWQDQKIAEAAAAARAARKAVIFAYDDGTEGVDRGGSDQVVGLKLPGYQDDLIAAVAAANPHTVVVLNTGDPVTMPWAGDVESILEMWYPGQRGAEATADALLGRDNPSGKLPVTFPDGTKFPTFDPGCTDTSITGNCPLYPGTAQPGFVSGLHSYRTITNQLTNGIFQGYRWYDKHDVAPLFAFGHGLSYTSFKYSKLAVRPRGDGFDVSFVVRNTGSRAGAEVPQVYLGAPQDPPAGAQFAVRALAGFERVALDRGESETVKVHIDERELSYWSTSKHDWALALGKRTVSVGSSSRDLRLDATIDVTQPALGEKGIGPDEDANGPGMAEAFRTVPAHAGRIDSLQVFLDGGTRARRLVAGVYADDGGHPGALLASGQLDAPARGDWNEVALSAASIEAGRPYWIAVLGLGGQLVLRDECCSGAGSEPSETSASRTLEALPATWATGAVYPDDGPLSAYAPLLEGGAGSG